MRSILFAVLAAFTALSSQPAAAHERRRSEAVTQSTPLAEANEGSRRHPNDGAFEGARTIHVFENGALYELFANPSYVSAILLEPGETLNSVAAGDTSRWMVIEAEGGSNGQTRPIVLIKPQAAGLRTNVVLITDRRTYLVEAISQSGSVYSAELAWSYPDAAISNAPIPSPGALNFDYRVRVVRGARPAWTPVRVFDDGRQTWIDFAPGVAAGDMPPLFVVTAEGAELVNYRVEAQRYLVDRVFDVGELRLGTRAQTIVRIERYPNEPTRARRSHRGHP